MWNDVTILCAVVKVKFNIKIDVYVNINFNPFRLYIGPRQYDFPVLLYVGKHPTRVLLRLFARCRNLSDAFPHVVRTLANR
jgi:hypothetical protein